MFMICGSRRVERHHVEPCLPRLVSYVRSGGKLVVGCARGADALVVEAVLSAGYASQLHIFAIGGADGRGFSRGARGAPVAMIQDAAEAGATMHWWAGGGPEVPITGRLVKRSCAAVMFTHAQGGRGVMGFVDSLPGRPWIGRGLWRSCGSGTWSTLAAAAWLGLPTYVCPVGLSFSLRVNLPTLPTADIGSWKLAQARERGLSAYRWIPERQSSSTLF